MGNAPMICALSAQEHTDHNTGVVTEDTKVKRVFRNCNCDIHMYMQTRISVIQRIIERKNKMMQTDSGIFTKVI